MFQVFHVSNKVVMIEAVIKDKKHMKHTNHKTKKKKKPNKPNKHKTAVIIQHREFIGQFMN